MTTLLTALCYAAAFTAAWMVAMVQSALIQDQAPIRHGWWLAGYIVVGFLTTWLAMASLGLALWLLPGMAGVFSASFRLALNELRDLPPGYMGPDPASDPAPGRSRYDEAMWRIAAALNCQPVAVALSIELGTAITVYSTIALCP